MSEKPILYGYDASVYVRSTRLVLMQKGVDYEYVRVANWDGYKKLPGFDNLHPFARVPVFNFGDFWLFETEAINRYVDEEFDGPSLQPDAASDRARMQQIMSVYDCYAHRTWVQTIVTERMFRAPGVSHANESVIAAACSDAEKAARVIGILLAEKRGKALDLADLHIAPSVFYLSLTPEGRELMTQFVNLRRWWNDLGTKLDLTAILNMEDEGILN